VQFTISSLQRLRTSLKFVCPLPVLLRFMRVYVLLVRYLLVPLFLSCIFPIYIGKLYRRYLKKVAFLVCVEVAWVQTRLTWC
jgi:hypothetical protein